MKRTLMLALALLTAGCTTHPHADAMDFLFPSRNACQAPVQAVANVQAVPLQAPVMVPVVQAAPVAVAPCAAPAPAPEKERTGICSWRIWRPFKRLFGKDP